MSTSRRDFLKTLGGMALLTIVPRQVLGGPKFTAPSDQLTKGIIGVGGIMTPDDAKAMLDAGADLLQLYTGYIYNGPGLVRDICRALVADAEAKAAAERAAAERAAAEKNNGKARSAATPRRTHAPARRNGSGSRKRRKRRTGACGIPNSGAIRSRLRTAGVLSQKHRL